MLELLGFGSINVSIQAELPLAGFPPASSFPSHQQSHQLHAGLILQQCLILHSVP